MVERSKTQIKHFLIVMTYEILYLSLNKTVNETDCKYLLSFNIYLLVFKITNFRLGYTKYLVANA